MPKKRRDRSRRQAANDEGDAEQADDENAESLSVLSLAGSDSSAPAAAAADNSEPETETVGMEEKLVDLVELLGEKRADTRIKCLASIVSLLRSHVLSLPSTWSHLMTLTSGLERCARKGKGQERFLAIDAFSLLCLQLDADELTQEMAEMKQVLLTIMTDKSAELRARSSACLALALGTFVSPQTDMGRLCEMLAHFEGIFTASGFKGDGSVPVHPTEVCELHCSAIDSWCLLFTFAGADQVRSALQKQVKKFTQILESGDVDLRIAAGQAIALIYEGAWDTMGDSFRPPKLPDMKETIKQLSTDGAKSRAKADRRRQRANFRDIFAYITSGEFNDAEVKFGPSGEVLQLDDWTKKTRYHFFSHVLQQGSSAHLEQNEFLRQVFELGSPIVRGPTTPGSRMSKTERRCLLQANEKALKQHRSAQRTKRQQRLSESQ